MQRLHTFISDQITLVRCTDLNANDGFEKGLRKTKGGRATRYHTAYLCFVTDGRCSKNGRAVVGLHDVDDRAVCDRHVLKLESTQTVEIHGGVTGHAEVGCEEVSEKLLVDNVHLTFLLVESGSLFRDASLKVIENNIRARDVLNGSAVNVKNVVGAVDMKVGCNRNGDARIVGNDIKRLKSVGGKSGSKTVVDTRETAANVGDHDRQARLVNQKGARVTHGIPVRVNRLQKLERLFSVGNVMTAARGKPEHCNLSGNSEEQNCNGGESDFEFIEPLLRRQEAGANMVKSVVANEVNKLIDRKAKRPYLSVVCYEQKGGSEAFDKEDDEKGEEGNDDLVDVGTDEVGGEGVFAKSATDAESTVEKRDDITASRIGDVADKSVSGGEEKVRAEQVVCSGEHDRWGGFGKEKGREGGMSRGEKGKRGGSLNAF